MTVNRVVDHLSRDHLDGTTLKGETLVVTFSRFDRVRMPHEANLPPDDMTKDFSGKQFEKYKRYTRCTGDQLP